MIPAVQSLVAQSNADPIVIIIGICVMYVIPGMFLESLSMILLTVPVIFPLVAVLDADPVWFCVLLVVLAETSLITPPIGMNLFVIRTEAPDVGIPTIYRGILPFIVADILRIVLLVAFPTITLILPSLLFG